MSRMANKKEKKEKKESRMTEGILLEATRLVKIIESKLETKNYIPESILEEKQVGIEIKQITPITGRDIEVYVWQNKTLFCPPLKLKLPSLGFSDVELAIKYANEIDRQIVVWQNSRTKERKLGLLNTDWSHLK